jgi:hypothetical protein
MKTKRLKTSDLEIPQGTAFLVEFTSRLAGDPEQITIHAETQAEAVEKALRGRIRLIPYDRKTDREGSYKGWSFLTISVDDGVPLPPIVVKAKDRLTVDYDGSGSFCESNACDSHECHRCFPRYGCKDHEKCEELSKDEAREGVARDKQGTREVNMKKQAKVAIVLETTGVDETDLMEMIDDMLDGGSIQSAIYERGGVTNGTGKKFKITSATVGPTGDGETEMQRDALAAELVQYAKAIATIVGSAPIMESVLVANGINPVRVRRLATGRGDGS